MPGPESSVAVDTSISVLVVDDSATSIQIMRDVLWQLSFKKVDEANGGTTALEKLRRKHYGLVISDLNMEPMSGYDLLRQVRADPGLGQVPFIIVTADAKVKSVLAAKKAGVDNFIVRPFSVLTMKAKIEAVFSAKRVRPNAIFEV
jgi:two-component system, chemotaxis family, chemotaxis protein CheY